MKTLTQLVGATTDTTGATYPDSFAALSQNFSAANIALGKALINNQHRYLLQKYFSNETTYTTSTVSQQQVYKLPANFSKLKTLTITIGVLKWTPTEIQSREEWDKLNVFPYYADIPSHFFVYPGGDSSAQVGIWPIPSTAGNTITINFKYKVPDLTFADYSTGNITTATVGSTAITGTSTAWLTTGGYPAADVSFLNLNLRIDPPYGDGLWYQIKSFTNATTLTLVSPIQNAPSITASSTYTIGQAPLLMEDFHDMLVYGALKTYFSTKVQNQIKYSEFKEMYEEKQKLLDEYSGSNVVQVNLSRRQQFRNPNLYGQTFG